MKDYEVRKLEKKIELLKKENSRVIICNTPEAKIFAELIPNIDKLYKFLRNNVGSSKVDLDYFDSKRKAMMEIAGQINDLTQKIAKEKEVANLNIIMIEKAR